MSQPTAIIAAIKISRGAVEKFYQEQGTALVHDSVVMHRLRQLQSA